MTKQDLAPEKKETTKHDMAKTRFWKQMHIQNLQKVTGDQTLNLVDSKAKGKGQYK